MPKPLKQQLTIDPALPQGDVVIHPHLAEAIGAALRQDILDACARFEAESASGDKGYVRALHLEARGFCKVTKPETVRSLFKKHSCHFRSGREIDPSKIDPVLIHVDDRPLWSDLFMVTRSFWSMPYNKGYGRRLRFVVYDKYHQGVMGILGLQSPPADLACRDTLFTYPEDKKLDMVNSTMDAYTVGAIPPYSFLLGGKLCAGMISSETVRQAYWRAYAGKKTEMTKRGVQQPLVAVTTTSAFGRSSQYNRLKYKDRLLAEPIGYTLGYGTLHLEHLYSRMCDFLVTRGAFKHGGYGAGPKIRWQNITNALLALQLPSSLLRHGVQREVFLFRFVEDLKGGMAGGSFGNPLVLPEVDFAEYWKERWAVPRAERFPHWNADDSVEILHNKLLELGP